MLLHHWAESEAVKKRRGEWEDKLPEFRSAVIAGMRSGARERYGPHEIASSEYMAIHEAATWLKKNRPYRLKTQVCAKVRAKHVRRTFDIYSLVLRSLS